MLNIIKFVIEIKKIIKKSKTIKHLKLIKNTFLNKKSLFYKNLNEIKKLPKEKRPEVGKFINKAKIEIENIFKNQKKILIKKDLQKKIKSEKIDITLPGRYIKHGNLHPISHSIMYMEKFFKRIGFKSIIGPEIEDNYYNFDALNIPIYHSSRGKNDTFKFTNNSLLRTHTSSVQIHAMKNKKPPIKIISSGKVYRNDYDKTHTPMFHQIEGLIIDKYINFKHLKTILYEFLIFFLKKKINIRFRPSYFPFTEPSAEIDIMDKNKNWLEILGCGIINPNILNNLYINPNMYSGLAFGIGVERLIMLKYNIKDLRKFFNNDIRFLKQFK